MPDYRRAYVPGGTFFFTLVTYQRRPIFGESAHVDLLRKAILAVRAERHFNVVAAVVLPDHLHLLMTLPPTDSTFRGELAG
jgi:putative transposase